MQSKSSVVPVDGGEADEEDAVIGMRGEVGSTPLGTIVGRGPGPLKRYGDISKLTSKTR
jgi:hypothetical protein